MAPPAVEPTAGQRKAAEDLRLEGNTLFGRCKYAAAADRYTEAITLAPSAALYVNRALCSRRAAQPAWGRVAGDARSALALDGQNLKAHYLLGMALRELGESLEAAISHLSRALEAARAKEDAIKDEIWRELAKAHDAAWKVESAACRAEVEALRRQLRALALAAGAAPPPDDTPESWAPPTTAAAVAGEAPGGGDAAAAPEFMPCNDAEGTPAAAGGVAAAAASAAAAAPGGSAAACVDWGALDRALRRAARQDAPGEVPPCFCCPLTMEVFRDPVSTASGQTYERSALMEHLQKVGAWDPISRVPTTVADVRPNVAMRGAVAAYLEEHPWAWHECY